MSRRPTASPRATSGSASNRFKRTPQGGGERLHHFSGYPTQCPPRSAVAPVRRDLAVRLTPAALCSNNRGMNYTSRRLSSYSFIAYVLALGMSIGIVWLGLGTAIANRTASMKTAAVIVTILGVASILLCFLVLWILVTEVIAFEIDQHGSIVLRRLWLKPLRYVKEVRLFMKLGCLFRSDGLKAECVPYVIVRADRKIVPMPAEVFSRLNGTLSRVQ